MAEKRKGTGRWKVPRLDWYIVGGVRLREDDKKFQILGERLESLESELKKQRFAGAVRAKMYTKLLDRSNVILGNVRAPECPKCGRPKTPGGIQWLDHAKCKRKQDTEDRSEKEKGKI